MKKSLTAAILALPLVLGPVIAPPPAQATGCDMSDWTFPFCKIGRPSIPRIDMGGPRPPLTPKNSVWCTAPLISVGGGGGWYLIDVTKHFIRFWPDYYHRTYVSIYWNGVGWFQTRQPLYTTVDCDA